VVDGIPELWQFAIYLSKGEPEPLAQPSLNSCLLGSYSHKVRLYVIVSYWIYTFINFTSEYFISSIHRNDSKAKTAKAVGITAEGRQDTEFKKKVRVARPARHE
jgi:hypothetical protein